MTKIKVISKSGGAAWSNLKLEDLGYVFSGDWSCTDYDWLVAYDELAKVERLACPRERTILATCEPVSIKHYSQAYAHQFGHLLTNRPAEAERHPHYHLARGYYKWFNDRTYEECRSLVMEPKSKLISAVCSSKQMKHTQHFDRFNLISQLVKMIPEIDWYGHGVRTFGKKYEVMDPYKYQIVVENHIAPHHWTEKLTDAFLSECLPFYVGAPDLIEDLPRESFIPIPLDNPTAAAGIIKSAIASGEYEKRREAILEAKRLVLSKYNFWAQVIEVIEASRNQPISSVSRPAYIYPRKQLRARSLTAALSDMYWHLRHGLL